MWSKWMVWYSFISYVHVKAARELQTQLYISNFVLVKMGMYFFCVSVFLKRWDDRSGYGWYMNAKSYWLLNESISLEKTFLPWEFKKMSLVFYRRTTVIDVGRILTGEMRSPKSKWNKDRWMEWRFWIKISKNLHDKRW